MAIINIPKSDLPVLKALSVLGDKEFGSLLSAIHITKPTLSQQRFVGLISEKAKAIEKSEVAAILRVVFVLYSMKESSGTSAKQLAKDIATAYAKTREKESDCGPKQASRLNDRLYSLLSENKTIAVTAKAYDVMTEHSHVFCRARILSDIRPVFSESTETASAAVVIHNLQIGFHDSASSEHKEFYVALDTNDIQSLKDSIERAEQKTIALQTILKQANVPYLPV